MSSQALFVCTGHVPWEVHRQQFQHAILQADVGQETDHAGFGVSRPGVLQLTYLDQVSLCLYM